VWRPAEVCLEGPHRTDMNAMGVISTLLAVVPPQTSFQVSH
jgi:hypothetical protein